MTYGIKGDGLRAVSAAVIRQAFRDLIDYKEAEREELEKQIRRGCLELYFGILDVQITPENLIKMARQKRESIPAIKRKKVK